MKCCEEDRLVNISKSVERIFAVYFQCKDIDFLSLQGKLEPLTTSVSCSISYLSPSKVDLLSFEKYRSRQRKKDGFQLQ